VYNKKYIVLLSIISIGSISLAGFWVFQKRACGQYKQVESYRKVQEIFDTADQQTLITFDVDGTLIAATDAILSERESLFSFPLWFMICAFCKYPSFIFNQTKIYLAGTLVTPQIKRIVFDPDIVRYIQQLRVRECPVVALTWIKTGSIGAIKDMAEWRADTLKDFGFDFQGQFQDMVFTAFPKYCGNYPCLCKGILCANKQPKGAVLGAFLDEYHLHPSRIISFDDFSSFLDSIAQECAKRKIPFTGYQVVGAKKFAGTWNTRRALLQLDYMMERAQWLSDQQADALLAKK